MRLRDDLLSAARMQNPEPQPLAEPAARALSGRMDTDMSKNEGQMPEQPSDAEEPSPNKGEQNPPIQPADEPWSKQ